MLCCQSITPSICPLCMMGTESGHSREMLYSGQYPGTHPSHTGGMCLAPPQVCTRRLPAQPAALCSSLLALLFPPAPGRFPFTLGFLSLQTHSAAASPPSQVTFF